MNGAALSRFNSRLARVAESLFPASIRIDGDAKCYVAATSGLHTENKLASDGGGLENVDVVSFRVRKELLSIAPTPGARILWVDRNRPVRVARVSDAGTTDPAWLISCEALT